MKSTKLFILCLFALSTSVSYAQYGGGGMRGGGGQRGGGQRMQGGGMQQSAGIPKNLLETCGLFLYDSNEIIKNCKVKDDAQQTQIKEIINNYWKRYQNTTLQYADKINNIKAIEQGIKASGQNREMLMEYFQQYRTQSQEIQKAMGIEHKAVNENITKLLDEKQTKRWKSYLRSLYEEKSYRAARPNKGERPSGPPNGRK